MSMARQAPTSVSHAGWPSNSSSMLGARPGPDLLPNGFGGASPTAREITVITDWPVDSVILILHVLLSASGMKRRIYAVLRSA